MIRTRVLSASKLAALALFVIVLAALAVYLSRHGTRSAAKPERPKLQGRLVAVRNNTSYVHEVDGRVRFRLTAGADKGYEDGTHELEQVRLESYGADGTRDDIVTADRAKVSDASDLDKLDAEFISNVHVETSDGLSLKTGYLRYDRTKNTVDTPEVVDFERKNLTGRSTGMLIEAGPERVHLLKDVDVTLKPEQPAKSEAGLVSGSGDQPDLTLEERAARRARKQARRAARQGQADGKVGGQGTAGRSLPAAGARAPARASPAAKGAALKVRPKLPVRIRGQSALLEKKDHRVTFAGSVVATQGADEMRADRMTGYIDAANHIERIEARSNSDLKEGGKGEVKSSDMDFFFGEGQRLVRCVATGDVYARSLGPEPLREARSETAELTFAEGPQGNTADMLKAEGNAVVHIHAPDPAASKPKAAERALAASLITLQFFEDGRNIRSAEASGGAVMTVTPVSAERGVDKKTMRAPQMSATFFREGNQIKTFNATGGVKVELESAIPGAHPLRSTSSERLAASFLPDSQDVERISQEGSFQYDEGDRHGRAGRAVYEGQAEFLSLRGGRPMGWDQKARTQADEVDYDRGKDETHARGDVRTTYYSRDATGNSTPMAKTKSPVFITAEKADARNGDGIAAYTGDARAWQDDNFVKADRIELYQNESRMVATGHVDSALYNVQRETSPGKRETVPAFASADRMTYSDVDRLVHYDGQVKARQGTDRIDASSVDVYLKSETSEVDHMVARGDVVLNQPGRHGSGDTFTYTADDGRAVLAGKNARVDDEEKGSIMGAQLTFYNGGDRIVVDNQHGTGRIRTTHRLTKGKENR